MSGGPGTASPGQIVYKEQSLKDLIFIAWAVPFYQLTTPSWMEDAFFDVVAKVPGGATRDDVRLMLQGLLAERFSLKMRREMKDLSGFVLTIAGEGAKLTPSPEPPAAPEYNLPAKFSLDPDGFVILPAGSSTVIVIPSKDGLSRLTAGRATMATLCSYLRRQIQRPVVDETRLSGVYDFHLAFTPEPTAPGASPPPAPGDSGATAPEASAPSITLAKALETQLGLKLVSKKVPVEILVIDHVEKNPLEN